MLTVGRESVAYAPHVLTEDQAAEGIVKRGVFGVVFNDVYDKLRTPEVRASAAVVWEVENIHDPPAHVRAVRPKFWTTGVLKMQEGKMYKIV